VEAQDLRDGEGTAEVVGARSLVTGDEGGASVNALPAPMIAVLEGSGRGGLDSVFASLLDHVDRMLPERRWEREGDWGDDARTMELFASPAASEGFWDEEVAAEAGKSVREMVAILVLIPLLTLVVLGALVMTLGA
jgi:hypothetical protein